ncbi:MAG TPA: LCP family protein [Nocardioides sp.]|nr:LCP family protein [Nocardioides sp.]
MADPPRGDGGPREGTPEYNWLYGNKRGSGTSDDATRRVPRQSAPPSAGDETRVMPAGTAREQRPSRPVPPNIAPPPRSSSGSSWRSRLPRPRLRWLWILLLLWLVYLIAIPIWAWTRVEKVDAEPSGNRPDEQSGTTYLVVGSDSADDLTEEQRQVVKAGDRSGNRTDTIMLLHTGNGPSLLMSIPRDSIVDIPGQGTNKINAATALGGPKLLVRTIEQNTGIRIDHFVEIGFGGVINMVDAVGGIEICPKQAMKDPDARLDIEKGCQEADGLTALAYSRSRKTYAARGDIDRARAQREVVSAIGHEAVSPWSIINPIRYYRLNMSAAEAVRVSEGTNVFSAARFAYAMTRVNGDGLTCTVPIADLAVNWDPERSEELFQHIIDDDTDGVGRRLCTPTGLAP